MKTIVLLIVLAVTNFITNAQSSEGITIQVTVPNVSNTNGALLFGLYDEATFMKAAPLQSAKGEISNGSSQITFSNVPPGTYGISCLHDINGNGQMDFETNGMPKESYGISNNNMSYGPPVWNDAKFEVGTEAIEIEIRL